MVVVNSAWSSIQLGLRRRLFDRLRRTGRLACGDTAEPSMVVIDSRTCPSAQVCAITTQDSIFRTERINPYRLVKGDFRLLRSITARIAVNLALSSIYSQ
jgi:hypothetical protein